MARTLRRPRYYGIRYYLRSLRRFLTRWSGPLAPIIQLPGLVLPWLMPLEIGFRYGASALALVGFGTALIWRSLTAKYVTELDIIAAGHDGESRVAATLAQLPKEWIILNDLALRIEGPIFQMDHLIISPSALWVLETKTQRGEITRAHEKGAWLVRRRGHTRAIVNPVEQNKSQVSACERLLHNLFSGLPCKGAVVVEGNGKFKLNWPILAPEELNNWLIRENNRLPVRLDRRQAARLAWHILTFQVKGKADWMHGDQQILLFLVLVALPFSLWLGGLLFAWLA